MWPEILFRIHWPIIGLVLLLSCIGLIGISGATAGRDGIDYVHKQIIWLMVALTVMTVVMWPSYRLIEQYAYLFFAVSLFLLSLVYFLDPIKATHRWIRVGSFQFQPSELAKLAYICALARYLMYGDTYRSLKGLIGPGLLTAVPFMLIVKEPDLGTSLILVPICFSMLFACGARRKHLLAFVALGIVAAPIAYFVALTPYQQVRVQSFLQQDDLTPDMGSGYHAYQSKVALGSGDLFGRGYKQGVQAQQGYLPDAHTDFVFAVIGEEWGFVGCAVMLVAFLVLYVLGLMIAVDTKEPFGQLVAVGIVVSLASQTAINTAVTVGLMPVTGMPLPFVSYGGTSLVVSFMAIGLLLNIHMRKHFSVAKNPFRHDD